MNEFIIEKFRVEYDENGKEILKEKTGEYRKKNFISLKAKERFSNADDSELIKLSTDLRFEDYSIGIATEKSYSKLAGYNANSGFTTTDTSYAGTDKLIIGNRLTGQDLSEVTQGDTVIHTLKNRYNPPSSGTREINSLILTGVNTSKDVAGLSNILLDAPCFQESDEILIVTYRYTYNYKETFDSIPFKDTNPQLAGITAHNLNLFNSVGSNVVVAKPALMAINSGSNVGKGKDLTTRTNFTNGGLGAYSFLTEASINPFEGYFKFKSDISTLELNGKLVNSYSFYPNSTVSITSSVPYYSTLAEVKLRDKLDSCIQNVYLKAKSNADAYATAPLPFYDLDNLGSSQGNVVVTEDFVSGDSSYEYKSNLIELLRIEVTQGGATGNAKYSVSTKYMPSLNSEINWKSETSSYFIGDVIPNSGNHVFNNLSTESGAISYALKELMATNMVMGLQTGELLVLIQNSEAVKDGLWVYNYDSGVDGFPARLDSTSVSGFNATDIRGVTSAEDGTIFVACAATGLWKLQRNYGEPIASTGVSRITNTGAVTDTACYAVNFCRLNGRFNSDAKIYALFDNELCVSVDGGDNWSKFNATTPTPFIFTGDFNKVVGICPNYHDTDKEVVIVASSSNVTKLPPLPATEASYNLIAFFWNENESNVAGTSQSATKNIGLYGRGEFAIYGGANKLFNGYFADNDLPTYKWVYLDGNFSLGALPRVCDNLGTNSDYLFNSNTYLKCFDLIDDAVLNETHVIAGSASATLTSSNLKGFAHGIIKDLNTNNDFSSMLFETKEEDNYLTYVARNVIVCSSTFDATTPMVHSKSRDAFGENKAYFMGFYDPANPNRDFYAGNPLNLWYNWTYSANTWSVDGTGAIDKITHTGSASLVRGLDIYFEDGSETAGLPVNFVQEDFFDIYLADGVVKDSYTEYTMDGMFFFGTSKEGTDFYPTTVPANPETNATVSLAVEFHKEFIGDAAASIAFEVDYIGQSGYSVNFDTPTPVDNNFALMGCKLESDFTIEFKMATSLSSKIIDAPSSESTYKPQFGLVNNTLNVGESGSAYVYGLTLKSGADHNQKLLYVYAEGVYESITINNYQPHLDEWKIVRTGQTIVLYRNNVALLTRILSTTVFRVMYSGAKTAYNGGVSSNAISIFNAKLTFNDYRLTSRIGNPTNKTGSWDANFGKMHIEEYILGIKKIFLDGVEASIIYDAETTTPAQGEVRICRGSGELVFSPDDAGKVITGSWRMIPCVNVREV